MSDMWDAVARPKVARTATRRTAALNWRQVGESYWGTTPRDFGNGCFANIHAENGEFRLTVLLADGGEYEMDTMLSSTPYPTLEAAQAAGEAASRSNPRTASKTAASPHWYQAGEAMMIDSRDGSGDYGWVADVAGGTEWFVLNSSGAQVASDIEGTMVDAKARVEYVLARRAAGERWSSKTASDPDLDGQAIAQPTGQWEDADLVDESMWTQAAVVDHNYVHNAGLHLALPGDTNAKPSGANPQVPTLGLDDSAMFEPDEVKDFAGPEGAAAGKPSTARKVATIAAQITDSTHSFTLAPGEENWIGNFTDQALAEMEAFWSSAEGQAAQPYMPGYADGTIQLIRDEKTRRTSSLRTAGGRLTGLRCPDCGSSDNIRDAVEFLGSTYEGDLYCKDCGATFPPTMSASASRTAADAQGDWLLRVRNTNRSLEEIQRYLYGNMSASQVEDGTIYIQGHDVAGFTMDAIRERLLSGMIGTDIVERDPDQGVKWASRTAGRSLMINEGGEYKTIPINTIEREELQPGDFVYAVGGLSIYRVTDVRQQGFQTNFTGTLVASNNQANIGDVRDVSISSALLVCAREA